MKSRPFIITSLIFIIMAINFCYCQFNDYSKMKLQALHKLGKEKLVTFQYSEAIKIYKEIMRQNPDDSVFQQKVSVSQEDLNVSLEKTKMYYDATILSCIDLPLSVLDLLDKLSSIYMKAGDFNTALIIEKEMRKAYVELPWSENTVVIISGTGLGSAPYSSEYYRLGLDIVTHEKIGRLLEQLGKRDEALKHYQSIILIVGEPSKLKAIPEEKRNEYKEKAEKMAKEHIQKLQNK